MRREIGAEEDLTGRYTILISMMRITVRSRGRVQNAGYHSFVARCAQETGVTGFIRNEPDGSVLIVAEGQGLALSLFKKIINAPDDQSIRVDSLEVTAGGANGEFSGFAIRD
jgi:acylphosphatase